MLTVTNLRSAVVIAPISMAKIEGNQSAKNTIALFTETLLPYAPSDEDTTDVRVMTTEGLYAIDSDHSGYELRQKLWDKGDDFRRKFLKGIRSAQKDFPRILPEANELDTFDTVRGKSSLMFRQLLGLLKNEADTNLNYREKLVADLGCLGQPESMDKIAFLNEEFVWGWALYNGASLNSSQRSLRKHDQGQTIICYPGALLASQIEAYRLMSLATAPLQKGRSIYLNTSLNRDEDVAETIAALNLLEPARRKAYGVFRSSGPSPSLN